MPTTRITVIGGTGYAGSAIVHEAARRGYEVISFSRNLPSIEAREETVRYENGSVLNADDRSRAVLGSDIVVSALSPRGELNGRLLEADLALAKLADRRQVRFGVIGGFSSLRAEPGAQRIIETGAMPAEFVEEGRQTNSVLSALLEQPETLDWFFVAPAELFGAEFGWEGRGTYRLGGEVALRDENGVSAISNEDFASAVIDEVEKPTHRRELFSVVF